MAILRRCFALFLLGGASLSAGLFVGGLGGVAPDRGEPGVTVGKQGGQNVTVSLIGDTPIYGYSFFLRVPRLSPDLEPSNYWWEECETGTHLPGQGGDRHITKYCGETSAAFGEKNFGCTVT